MAYCQGLCWFQRGYSRKIRDQNKVIVFNHHKVERTISTGGGFNHVLDVHSKQQIFPLSELQDLHLQNQLVKFNKFLQDNEVWCWTGLWEHCDFCIFWHQAAPQHDSWENFFEHGRCWNLRFVGWYFDVVRIDSYQHEWWSRCWFHFHWGLHLVI